MVIEQASDHPARPVMIVGKGSLGLCLRLWSNCRTFNDVCVGTLNFAKIFKAIVFRETLMAVVGS